MLQTETPSSREQRAQGSPADSDFGIELTNRHKTFCYKTSNWMDRLGRTGQRLMYVRSGSWNIKITDLKEVGCSVQNC